MRTLLVDDDKNSRMAARAALKDFDEIEIVGEASGSEELFDFLENDTADLIFLDIELGEELGFDIVHRLEREHPSVMVIFLTGHSSYAIDGYDFAPISFLTKPINNEKLRQAIARAQKKLSEEKEQDGAKIMIKCIQGYQMIAVGDILYIERRDRKNYLVTRERELQIGYYTMAELLDMLEPYGFFMCHQSYLIALDKVTGVSEERRLVYSLTLEGRQEKIPVGRGHYEQLRNYLKKHSIRQL